jgi:uncharacterized protein YqjF (DUF2071 family)
MACGQLVLPTAAPRIYPLARHIRPVHFVSATAPLGNWSQDFGLFTDYKDGRSYALHSDGDSKEGRDVYLISYNEDTTAPKGHAPLRQV